MKICGECGLPLTYTKKLIEATWKFVVNNPFDRSNITSNTKKTKIEYELKDCLFSLEFSKKPMYVIEHWETPFGSYESKVNDNQRIYNIHDKWFKVLSNDNEANLARVMDKEGLFSLDNSSKVLCAQCENEKKVLKKSSPKKRKRMIPKTPQTASIVDKRKDVMVEELKVATLGERIAAAKKQKISREKLIIMYLKERVTDTKERHIDTIAELLDLERTQVLDLIDQLSEKNIVQKEFEFSEYYILTKDFQSEVTRKYLEIQDYLKNHLDDPTGACTQVSISLSFDLPFSVVGVLLNGMLRSQLLTKETIQKTTHGTTRRIRYYLPKSY